MFLQFFGNFLLVNKYISMKQLVHAIDVQGKTHLRLGTLAINSGYMTTEQVNAVHVMQEKVDDKFGHLAISLGYLTDSQLTEILSIQQPDYLVLGQTIVDLGYMSCEKFEEAITKYNKLYSIGNDKMANDKQKLLDDVFAGFYHFGDSTAAATMSDYVFLLFNNLIRFISSEFVPDEATYICDYHGDNVITQTLTGDIEALTSIEGDEKALLEFAKLYACEDISSYNDYAKAVVSEFLNLHNGLFAVNMSNQNNKNISLTPQEIKSNYSFDLTNNSFCIPFEFKFGRINFILSM